MNITIVEAFITLKEFALNYREIADKLKELEKKYDKQFKDVYEAINYLLKKDSEEIEYKKRSKIGFDSGKKS